MNKIEGQWTSLSQQKLNDCLEARHTIKCGDTMKTQKRGKKRKRLGGYRIPTSRGTVWHKDKSKYNRRKKHNQKGDDTHE